MHCLAESVPMPEAVPTVSVIICTRDRAESLRDTLQSLHASMADAALQTEIVIVDNASQDHTPAVVDQMRPLFGAGVLQYVSEPAGGQAKARNTGIACSSGTVIAFTDDDVRFPPDWLARLVAPLLNDEADAVAGGVRLASHLVKPWMTSLHRSWLASTESIDPQHPTLVGANMAFARHVLDRVPGFDENLGPGALGFADDSQFSDALRESDYRTVSRFDVFVEHHFDLSRLTRPSFESMARRHGQTMAYLDVKHRSTTRLRYAKFLLVSLPARMRHWHAIKQGCHTLPDRAELEFLRSDAFWVAHTRRSIDTPSQRKQNTRTVLC